MFVYLPGDFNHNDGDLYIKVIGRIRNAWCSFRKYTFKLHDRPSAPLELKIRMLRAEVLETMLYGCDSWSPRVCHYDTLRRVHHGFLTRCISVGERTIAPTPRLHIVSGYAIKTRSESIEATVRRRRVFFAGFVTRMEDTRLPKCVMCGELVGGTGCVGGVRKKSGWDISWTTSELSVSTPISGRLQPRARGNNAARRRNKGWNVSWRNASLQRKSGLDYGMQ